MAIFYDALLLGGPRSGVEVAVAELGCALVEAGVPLTVVCRRQALGEDDWLTRAQVRVAPWWAAGRLGRIAAEQFWLPRLGGPRDLVHGPAYVLPLAWKGPAVLTIYDLIALRHPEWTRPANARHYTAVVPRSVRKADAVIVPASCVAEELGETLGVAEDKIRVIPLGVRRAMCQPADAPDFASLVEAFGDLGEFFAVVGNIEPKKNIRGIVAAFDIAAERIPHSLVIAGCKSWRSGPDLAAIAAARHRDRIRILGAVTDGQLRALYARCTAVVQWSLYEGFGFVPLEAMRQGAAVIISDGGALPETAGPGAHLVPLGQPEALAEAMVKVATDTAFRRELSERGRRWSERFTWSAHAAAVAEIYRALT